MGDALMPSFPRSPKLAWAEMVLGTWELFGSFNVKEMGAWEQVSDIENFNLKFYFWY
jgi:hypothetical protein